MTETSFDDGGEQLTSTMERISTRSQDLELRANGFARAMSQAFSRSASDGLRFDDVLKTLGLRLSNLALRAALRPLDRAISGGISNLFGSLSGGDLQQGVLVNGTVQPFASGGVIGAPAAFALGGGGLGIAGEAGPEAILPLARGPDGRLGVASAAAAPPAAVTVHITTQDAESFRRSEAYVSGLIARAVARGQRSF